MTFVAVRSWILNCLTFCVTFFVDIWPLFGLTAFFLFVGLYRGSWDRNLGNARRRSWWRWWWWWWWWTTGVCGPL